MKIIAVITLLMMFCSSCMRQCENLVVLAKDKCTFDRDHLSRVCVVRLGEKTGMSKKTIRGRVSATYLPEPIEVGNTQVKVCIYQGKKTFEKL